MTSFWAFVNMLQILSYLPVIDCFVPSNLEIFLTKYLAISKTVFQFQIVPSSFPNPLSWMGFFLTSPLNIRLELMGYNSVNFLYNFADELFTWVLLGLTYVALWLLNSFLPAGGLYRFRTDEPHTSLHSYVRRWKREYEFNTICRVLIECFLNMTFCSILNIWNVSPN